MKNIFLILFLISGFVAQSQVQYGGVIRAKNNSLTIGEIKRTDDALKVNDSTLKVILDAINAKLPSNLTVTSTRLLVDASGTTQPISGTITANQGGTWNINDISGTISLPTGAATAAKQPALGTAGTASADVISIQGIAGMTAVKVDGSAVTQPVSGTVTINALTNSSVVKAQMQDNAGNAINSTSNALHVNVQNASIPVTGTFWQATQPVSIASTLTVQGNKAEDDAFTNLDAGLPILAVRQSSPANTSGTNGDYEPLQVNGGRLWTSATIDAALPAGTNNIGDVDVLSLPALSAGTNNIGDVDVLTVPADPFGANADAASATGSISAKLRFIAATGIPVTALPNVTISTFPDNEPFNVAQINGVTPLMGAGNTGTGSLRVTIASDQAAVSTSAAQSGTWTVQPGNTANTTPWLVTNTPGTSGGYSVDSRTALTGTVVSAKASAGQLYGYYWYNPNASAVYIQVFNTASGSVTLGTTTPVYVLTIPATSGANVEFGNGIAHSTAITYAATTTATGSTSPASSLTGFMLYK